MVLKNNSFTVNLNIICQHLEAEAALLSTLMKKFNFLRFELVRDKELSLGITSDGLSYQLLENYHFRIFVFQFASQKTALPKCGSFCRRCARYENKCKSARSRRLYYPNTNFSRWKSFWRKKFKTSMAQGFGIRRNIRSWL